MSATALNTRLTHLQRMTHATITAERDEMHYAIAYLADTLTEFCAQITTITLTPSDQGDWLTLETTTCTAHDGEPCPANSDEAHDAAWEFPPHIYLTQIGHLVDEFGFTQPPHIPTLTLTITPADVARIKEHLGVTATTVHINTATLDEVTAVLNGHAQPISDGDCGSVWGETRTDQCPPHVIINDPTPEALAALTTANIAHVTTSKDDWADMPIEHGWTEPACPHN